MGLPILFGGGAPSRYRIANSLRFRASNTANLSRTPAGAGNRRTMTFVANMKRGALGTNQQIFGQGAGTAGGGCALYFPAGDTLRFYDGTTDVLVSNAVFRDPTAHIQIVLLIDTTQATAANRVRMFVNGVELTYSFTSYPAQNTDLLLNQAVQHRISGNTSASLLFDGLLSDVYFIDGQALTPSSFGQIDPATNQWVPRRYSGTYGTNGFFLEFKNATSTTTIGHDTSGNGNHWTTSGISVTSGVTFDQMTDTPSNNFCTWNPLNSGSGGVMSRANLAYETAGTAAARYALGTIAVSSGKWYWEVTVGSTYVSIYPFIGIATSSSNGLPNDALFDSANAWQYISGGSKKTGASTTAYGASFTTNDVIGVELDLDVGTLAFRKNNLSQGVAFSGLSGTFVPMIGESNSSTSPSNVNFGQRAFAGTPSSGFLALNTSNLP